MTRHVMPFRLVSPLTVTITVYTKVHTTTQDKKSPQWSKQLGRPVLVPCRLPHGDTNNRFTIRNFDTHPPPPHRYRRDKKNKMAMLAYELWLSSEIVFGSHLTWLLVFGPIAIAGQTTGVLGEFVCFIFAGLALIPCAERLSFITEQVAVHTNSTIGALLNATFGNAPEFLLSGAALRAGFYRVVQLTLLGSILCNLLLVFGMSCFIGGLRWQVQEVIMTSGNVSIGMMLIGTAGLLLPAVLKLGNQEMFTRKGEVDCGLQFSRFNAAIMLAMYVCYLFFQLATHKDEFDDDNQSVSQEHRKQARRNAWCHCCFFRDPVMAQVQPELGYGSEPMELELPPITSATPHGNGLATSASARPHNYKQHGSDGHLATPDNLSPVSSNSNINAKISNNTIIHIPQSMPTPPLIIKKRSNIVRAYNSSSPTPSNSDDDDDLENSALMKPLTTHISRNVNKTHLSDKPLGGDDDSQSFNDHHSQDDTTTVLIPLRAGIIWLLAITLCISAISDVIVDTIDGFADKCQLSEIFTSVIIVPFFSNIAEQVSAVLFAYRNKMDLCLGVTVGSAIQISTCVLPGCILCGWASDRSITLFFEGYETCCLVLGVLSVSAILHGGTTNWLVGVFFIGMYLMFAAGFWFHIEEDLSIDEELILRNVTMAIDGDHVR